MLATRVYLPKLKQEVPPAVLFGLAKPVAPAAVAAPAVVVSNVPVPALTLPVAPPTNGAAP